LTGMPCQGHRAMIEDCKSKYFFKSAKFFAKNHAKFFSGWKATVPAECVYL